MSSAAEDAALRERNRAVVQAFFTSNLDNPRSASRCGIRTA